MPTHLATRAPTRTPNLQAAQEPSRPRPPKRATKAERLARQRERELQRRADANVPGYRLGAGPAGLEDLARELQELDAVMRVLGYSTNADGVREIVRQQSEAEAEAAALLIPHLPAGHGFRVVDGSLHGRDEEDGACGVIDLVTFCKAVARELEQRAETIAALRREIGGSR
jgi:hypothetical protein